MYLWGASADFKLAPDVWYWAPPEVAKERQRDKVNRSYGKCQTIVAWMISHFPGVSCLADLMHWFIWLLNYKLLGGRWDIQELQQVFGDPGRERHSRSSNVEFTRPTQVVLREDHNQYKVTVKDGVQTDPILAKRKSRGRPSWKPASKKSC